MSDTDNPTTGAGPAPFGVRLDAATLARLDAYAARIDKKRGGAAVRVVAAGLDALEGLPVRAPAADPSREVSPGPALDVDALADALIDRLPAPTVRRVEPPDSGAIAAGIVLGLWLRGAPALLLEWRGGQGPSWWHWLRREERQPW